MSTAFGIRTRNLARNTPATARGTNILHPGLSSLTRKADFTAASLRTNTSQTAPAFKLSISLQIWLLTGPSWMMRARLSAEDRATERLWTAWFSKAISGKGGGSTALRLAISENQSYARSRSERGSNVHSPEAEGKKENFPSEKRPAPPTPLAMSFGFARLR